MNLREDEAKYHASSIRDLIRYIGNNNGYVAGGCFKNLLNSQKVKDVDVFFRSKEDFDSAVSLFENNLEYVKYYENENVVAFKDLEKEINVELIKTVFLEPAEMLKSFDFTICQFALFHKEEEKFNEEKNETEKIRVYSVLYHENFFKDLFMKRLVLDGDEQRLKFKMSVFNRFVKYMSYGYTPCFFTKLKIAKMLAEVDKSDISFDENLYPTPDNIFLGID
jgi:hypothetical protein